MSHNGAICEFGLKEVIPIQLSEETIHDPNFAISPILP